MSVPSSSRERFRGSDEYRDSKRVAGGKTTDYDLRGSGLWRVVEPARTIPHLGQFQEVAASFLSYNWRIVAETQAHRDPNDTARARRLLVVKTDMPFNFDSPLFAYLRPKSPDLRINLSPDDPSFEFRRNPFAYTRDDSLSKLTEVKGRRFWIYEWPSMHSSHTSDPNRYLIELTYANLKAALTDELGGKAVAKVAVGVPQQGESIVPEMAGVGLDVAEEFVWQAAYSPEVADAAGACCEGCCQVAGEIVGAALGGSN